MKNLKVGDIIEFKTDDLPSHTLKEEVRGIVGNVLFTREINEDGSTGITEFHGDIEDLITMGWTKSTPPQA